MITFFMASELNAGKGIPVLECTVQFDRTFEHAIHFFKRHQKLVDVLQ
jgi:hypothetical protein